jgi:hypothetical protein
MGQYHKVYNTDKKECINAHRINNGLKLLEQMGHEKSTASAVFLLLSNSNGRGGGDAFNHDDNKRYEIHPFIGRWAGDRLVVQGDYAEESDQAYLTDEGIGEFKDISYFVNEMLECVYGK